MPSRLIPQTIALLAVLPLGDEEVVLPQIRSRLQRPPPPRVAAVRACFRGRRGVVCSRKRVARLLRLTGLQGCHRRKGLPPPRRTPGTSPAPDLVRRDFAAPAPDRLWVADITSVPTWAGFLSLAVVLDVHSRRIVGWAMADHLRSELVIEAVDMAVWRRRPTQGVIHHSDQGSQYTSLAFGRRLREAGLVGSMGSRGDCFDNATAESFLPPSNASCSLVTAFRRGAPPASRYSITSKGSTTCTGDTPRSAISPRRV